MRALATLLPPGFVAPTPPGTHDFAFDILGPQYNESDLAAWSGSIAHIRTSPGWSESRWPQRAYTLEENLADLVEHRAHHLAGQDFAWTVLDPTSPGAVDVIGCVYLKPAPGDENARYDAIARSWVRRDLARLDVRLRHHLRTWFRDAWPLAIEYAGVVDDPLAIKGFCTSGGAFHTIASKHVKLLGQLDHAVARFEPERTYPERQVNDILANLHPDVAALRRYLVDEGYLEREAGIYRRTMGTFSQE